MFMSSYAHVSRKKLASQFQVDLMGSSLFFNINFVFIPNTSHYFVQFLSIKQISPIYNLQILKIIPHKSQPDDTIPVKL